MADLVFKFIRPFPLDIDGTQRWLEELAAEGVHLVHWWPFFSVFQRGEPKRVRYRLDPGRTEPWERNVPNETRDTYQEMGWNYLGTAYPGKFKIFVCEDPAAPELYTDLNSLSLAMKGVAKDAKIQFSLITTLLFLSVLLLRQDIAALLGPTPVQDIIDSFSPLDIWTSLYPWLFAPIEFLFYLRLLRTLRKLRNGEPLPRSDMSSKVRSLVDLVILAILAMALLLQFTVFKVNQPSGPHYTPPDDLTFPLPSLVELEDRPDFSLVPFSDDFDDRTASDHGCHVTRWASTLAPVQYRIELLGGGEGYTSTLSITLWELRYPELSQKLMGELLTAPHTEQLASLDVEGVDQAVLCQNSSIPGQTLLLRRGNRVAKLSYQGEASLESQLPACAAMMAADWSFS